MTASPHIEAFAREPFAVGAIDDEPRDACRRMGWHVVGRDDDDLVAEARDGRRFVVHARASGCVAREEARR